MSKNPRPELHLDVLPLFAREAFERCTALPLFSSGGWYLAGGTALALHIGHRQSQDLDFFTAKKTVDENEVEQRLSREKHWKTSSKSAGTLYGELAGGKVSLIAYPFFKPSEPFVTCGTVSILQPKDIAVMKITTISQRGRKRDFVDLYWLCRNLLPLSESFYRVEKQYTIKQNPNHILKSLLYFDDAENDPMPTLFFSVTWEEIKKYFETEVPKIARELMGLT